MRQHGRYPDRDRDRDAMSYGASQMQHMPGQRVLHNATADTFPGRLDSYSSQEQRPYRSSKPEGQGQWDRDGPKSSNQRPSHAYADGQGVNGTRSYYQGQMMDPNLGAAEKQVNRDPRGLPFEQAMEIGYEDNQTVLTFEGMEQKFIDEIMKLTKELNNAEDAEITRHKEEINEINSRYQGQLLMLRNKHADRREEFLRKESEARRNQYEQAGMSQYSSTSLQEAHQGGGTAQAAAGHAHHHYGPGQHESYRDQPPLMGAGRVPGARERAPYPQDRAYNTGPRFY